jgi:hypothetical protein
MNFSIFPSAYDTAGVYTISLKKFLEHVQQGRWRAQVELARQAKTKDALEEKKRALPVATLSGIFSERKSAAIEQHSGLLQIDLDHLQNPTHTRNLLGLDPHIIASFLSPSGKGVKGIMVIPADISGHRRAFEAAQIYMGEVYDLAIDKATKDVARACYVSFDPQLRMNPSAKPLDVEKWAPKGKAPRKEKKREFVARSDEASILASALKHLSAYDYEQWIRMGMALKASELSDSDAYALWDAWSSSAENYSGPQDTAHRWRGFRADGGVSTGSLISAAKEQGWTPPGRGPEPARPEPARPVRKLEVIEGNVRREVEVAEPEPESIEGLLLDEKGRPKGVLANAEALIRHHLGEHIASDEWSHATVITQELPWGSKPGPWRAVDDTRCSIWLQRLGCNMSSIRTVAAAVESVADERTVHPLRDWLNSLTWDGTERLDAWLTDYCGAAAGPYTAAVGRKWLTAAVARVFEPGVKFDTMLVLEGEQGIGKSSILAALGGEWFSDDFPDLHGKSAAERTVGSWIIELSELDALGRSEVSAVKAFISRRTDRYRPAYGTRVEEYPRTCVFAGSVNPTGGGYLRDTTGNRRFWPVPCSEVNVAGLLEVREQLFAEAVKLWRSGEHLWLEDAEVVVAARKIQEDRQQVDPWNNLVVAFLEATTATEVSLEMIYEDLKLDAQHRNQSTANRIASILQKQGWGRFRSSTTGRPWRYKKLLV